jgi:hypothetical protein
MSNKSPTALLGILAMMAGSIASSGIYAPGTAPHTELPPVPVLDGIPVPDPKKKKRAYGAPKLTKRQRKQATK